ncbi:kinase-like domain-containing protein [Coprinopsis sp. MPI-PUGE-AT-0042]|nr:kinase-like domain-containing protein [Coprinopsis sp. MPI-PUGE-AT-0042]
MTDIPLSPSALPRRATEWFLDSNFFTRHTLSDIPSFEQLKAPERVQCFPGLGLVVKRVAAYWKQPSSLAEGQCLWVLPKLLPQIRVPEIYGWRTDDEDLYLFMEHIENSKTLHELWDQLTEEDKSKICWEVGTMIKSLRQLRLDTSTESEENDFIIGGIGGQPLRDEVFFGKANQPFRDTCSFYKFLTGLTCEERVGYHHDYPQQFPALPYDAPIVFTHGDLNFSNILVTRSQEGVYSVAAIIDWERGGWMPKYWDYCRTRQWARTFEEKAQGMIGGLELVVDKEDDEVWYAMSVYLYYRDPLNLG